MIAHSGIGTHIGGLLEGWRDVAPDFRPTLLGDPAALAQRFGEAARYPIVLFRAPVYGLREQLAFPARRTRGALLHCPHYNIALRHAGPLVVTIHDLIHLDNEFGLPPGIRRVYARWMLRTAIRRARHVFAVSQATANDLAARLAVAREEITVTYNAPSKAFVGFAARPDDIQRFRREADLPGDYLLTVGLYKPHKNLDRLLEAFKPLCESGRPPLSLVIAGTQEKERPGLNGRLAQLGMRDEVRVLDWLAADRMPLLYAGATALIHPALVEGFGLPIVEAQAVGTPVAASRASAVAEVAGEGALYFDPRDVTDLARTIVALLGDAELRSRLAAAGRRNVERFSWRESARKVLSVYEQVK
jgi:glycosyltransferase involved in cell wall biosynthesis